jgi:hypothetical protein
MFTQPYSNVFPVVRLFRRLLAEGVSIGDMQAKIDSMKASGEIKFPDPREQLPERWWLVELRYDTPHGRKLSIETDDVNRPLDPRLINCCERLPPPGHDTIGSIEPILPMPKPKPRKPGGGRRPIFEQGQLAWLRQRYHVAVKADPLLKKHAAGISHVKDLAKTEYGLEAGEDTVVDQIIRPVLAYFSMEK